MVVLVSLKADDSVITASIYDRRILDLNVHNCTVCSSVCGVIGINKALNGCRGGKVVCKHVDNVVAGSRVNDRVENLNGHILRSSLNEGSGVRIVENFDVL